MSERELFELIQVWNANRSVIQRRLAGGYDTLNGSESRITKRCERELKRRGIYPKDVS